MRLAGSKKAAADMLEFGGNDQDVVSLLPEEPEDMVSAGRGSSIFL
jgi:protein pelota